MIYKIKIKRKIRNIRVYSVLRKKSAQKNNFMTNLFIKIFSKPDNRDEDA